MASKGRKVARPPDYPQFSKINGNHPHQDAIPDGHVPYPDNPNGSQADVAGVCDETGRVFGLMPHPERFVDATQHPRWTREGLQEHGDGLLMFQNAVRYFQS